MGEQTSLPPDITIFAFLDRLKGCSLEVEASVFGEEGAPAVTMRQGIAVNGPLGGFDHQLPNRAWAKPGEVYLNPLVGYPSRP